MIFVLQHVWSRWTKASRSAAHADLRRPLQAMWPLRTPGGSAGPAWLHEIRALEAEEFRLEERALPLTRSAWEASTPAHPANLRWRILADCVEIDLTEPWPALRRTRWPQALPSPFLILRPGDTARVDWNGRFQASAAGADRSYIYDDHSFRLAFVEQAHQDLFTAAPVRKSVDLRTRIY